MMISIKGEHILINEQDIMGHIYGDMKVVSYIGKTKNHVKIYKVRCEICGKEKNIQFAKLNRMETVYHNNKIKYIKEFDKNIGLKINDYTIIERCEDNTEYYIAKCDVCGTTFRTTMGNFKKGYGTYHDTCTFHIARSKYLKRFRKIYSGMRYRTTKETYDEYYLYGGRGISSDYFSDFMVFYKEMFGSYVEHCKLFGENNTSLDRINVNGNYETSNCRWATNIEQGNNKRDNNIFIYDNKLYTLAELCELLKLNYATIFNRVNNLKWNLYDCFEADRYKHNLKNLGKGSKQNLIETLPRFKEIVLGGE